MCVAIFDRQISICAQPRRTHHAGVAVNTERLVSAVDRRIRRLRGQPPRAGDVAVQAFTIQGVDIASAPTNQGPAGDGAPVSRWVTTITSEDGVIESGVWDSTAGRHDICFDFDEWVHILEGEAHVTAEGQTRTLRAGDVAFFHAGVHMVWDVPKYVRKVWVQRHRRPGLLSRAAKRLTTGVRGLAGHNGHGR